MLLAKKYNISSKSDMRKFERDVKQKLVDMSTSAVMSRKYLVDCPLCGTQVNIPVGKSLCPACGRSIDFKLNVHLQTDGNQLRSQVIHQ